jgi:hypothetical protein
MPRKIWTAAELEQLSRAEQQRIFDESLVTDPAEAPPELLQQARADVRRHIEEHETRDTG